MRDFILPDFDGTEHSLSDYKGQVIILNFWAVGCPPCVEEMPDFDKVGQKEGVVLVTVAQKNILGNEKEKSYEFIKQFETVALWDEDHDTVNVYPSQYYPHTYIIDRSGTVRFVMNSASYELLDELVSFCDEKLN
jgi:cytochrome c-type biogenesis protein